MLIHNSMQVDWYLDTIKVAGFEGLKYVINIGIENVLRVYSLIKILECQCINDLCFDVVLLIRMSEA